MRYCRSFELTVERLKRFVAANPGTTFRQAIRSIPHHYGSYPSARRELSRRIRSGEIDGIELRKEGCRLLLFPRQDAVTKEDVS